LPKKKFKVLKRTLGIAMQCYYGGRVECRIRRSVVPVVHTDFTSQYPTVNALLGNWRTLIGESVDFEECTKEVEGLLHHATLDSVFILMTTVPSGGQREVVPDTLRIVLQQYLNKVEAKSLAPDGSPCSARTSGLLRRVHVMATDVLPVN
jgi:hypothetical protein